MFNYYHEIDENVLTDIQKYEELHLSKFKSEFDCLCLRISHTYGWNYIVSIQRWIDTVGKIRNKPLDGYTAALQVDFTDADGNMIEVDENVCSFFENITFISFALFQNKYRVFQNENLKSIREEVKQFIDNVEKNIE